MACIALGACYHMSSPSNLSSEPDAPVNFGYKMMWLAIRSDSTATVVEALNLREVKPANWGTGIEHCYDYSQDVFVTPPIDGWVLVVGTSLPGTGDARAVDRATPFLTNLAKQFSEVQYYGTHRVVGFLAWAKFVAGRQVRAYAFLGEQGHTIWNSGDLTDIERTLPIVLPHETVSEAFWEQDEVFYANEDTVLDIAGKWSINPMMLEEQYSMLSTGVLGALPHK